MNIPLVTVITATTGNPLLKNALSSVKNQTYTNIQHLVCIDGPERSCTAHHCIRASGVVNSEGYRLDVIDLPYSIGKDRWNGHRIYGACSYIAEGDYVLFLDDDNSLEPEHIERCVSTLQQGHQWVYSFRKIVDKNQQFICQDNCESLGKWASILHPEDFFVDVNCYFLPKLLAIQISPIWYRKFRELNQAEVDRVISHTLRQMAPQYECTYEYSVNYTTGTSPLSVQTEFFIQGNATMLEKYNQVLPWKKGIA